MNNYTVKFISLITILIVATYIFSIPDLNKDLFFFIYNLGNHNHILNGIMIFIAQYLVYIAVLIYLLYFLLFNHSNISNAILSVLIIGVISYILSKIGTHIISDPRPYIEYSFKPISSISTDNGFPSDHTLISVIIASSMYLYNKKMGILLLLIAIIVAIGRVFIGAHHPLDILGSFTIVTISTFIYILITRLSVFASFQEKLKSLNRSL